MGSETRKRRGRKREVWRKDLRVIFSLWGTLRLLVLVSWWISLTLSSRR